MVRLAGAACLAATAFAPWVELGLADALPSALPSEDKPAITSDETELLAYGAYLAGECTGCHLPSDAGTRIPRIHGLPAPYFVEALEEYRTGVRSNDAMQSAARSLDREQMLALAAYFQSLADADASP